VVVADPNARPPGPQVVLASEHLALAERALEQLHRQGLRAALIDSTSDGASAWCTWHPTHLLAGACRRCGAATCSACTAAASGALLCPTCLTKTSIRSRNLRLRQLFAILLFSFFLYELHLYLERDRRGVDPRRPVRVVITQFIPPGQVQGPVLQQLNDDSPDAPFALRSLATWYQAERERYTGRTDDALHLDIRGPWPQRVDPPAVDMSGPLRSAWTAWRHTRWFRAAAASHGVDVDRYAVKLYIIFQKDAEDLASHSRANEKSRFAVAWIDLEEANPAYALLTVAHELAHALGAEDLYDPDSYLARYPEGFVDPNRVPLYPQPAAELMAADLPIGPGVEREVRSMSETRIGAHTAAQMGWISPEQAARAYEKAPLQASPPPTPTGDSAPPPGDPAGASGEPNVAEPAGPSSGGAVPTPAKD
jgi:hypothetical protein